MLIDEYFNGEEGCPVCRIKRKIDERLTDQYLGEGVMEDNTRKEVNKLGFCTHHYGMLFSFKSKLGLGLQVSTRLNTISKEVFEPKNLKQAKKQAESVLNFEKSCVVCKYLNEHMVRYYKTIAEVYNNVFSFEEKLDEVDGFCLEHYAELLKYSGYAGGKQKEYVAKLYEIQSKKLAELKENIDEFTFHFDYRHIGKPLSNGAKESLKTASRTFYGTKSEI